MSNRRDSLFGAVMAEEGDLDRPRRRVVDGTTFNVQGSIGKHHYDPSYLGTNNAEPVHQAVGEELQSGPDYIKTQLAPYFQPALAAVLEQRPADPVHFLAQQLQASSPYKNRSERTLNVEVIPSVVSESASRAAVIGAVSDVQPVKLTVNLRSDHTVTTEDLETGRKPWRHVGAHMVLGMVRPDLETLNAATKYLAGEEHCSHVCFVILSDSETVFIDGKMYIGDGTPQLQKQLGLRVPFHDVAEKIQEAVIDDKKSREKCDLPEDAVRECGLRYHVETSCVEMYSPKERRFISPHMIDELNELTQDITGPHHTRGAMVLVATRDAEQLTAALGVVSSTLAARGKYLQGERLKRAEDDRKARHEAAINKANTNKLVGFGSVLRRRTQLLEDRSQRDMTRRLRMRHIMTRLDRDPDNQRLNRDYDTWSRETKTRDSRRELQDSIVVKLTAKERSRAILKIQCMVRTHNARKKMEEQRKTNSPISPRLASDGDLQTIFNAPRALQPEQRFGEEALYTAVRHAMQEVSFSYPELLTLKAMLPPPVDHVGAPRWIHKLKRIPHGAPGDVSSEDESLEPVYIPTRPREPLTARHLLANPHALLIRAIEDSGHDMRNFIFEAKYVHYGTSAIQRRAYRHISELVLLLMNIVFTTLSCHGHASVKKDPKFSAWMQRNHNKILRTLTHQHEFSLATPPVGVPVPRFSGPLDFRSGDFVITQAWRGSFFGAVSPTGDDQPTLRPPWEPRAVEEWEQPFLEAEETLGSPGVRYILPGVPVLCFVEPAPIARLSAIVSELTNSMRFTAALFINTCRNPVVYVKGIPYVALPRGAPTQGPAIPMLNADIIATRDSMPRTPTTPAARRSTLRRQRAGSVQPFMPKPPTGTPGAGGSTTEPPRHRRQSLPIDPNDMVETPWLGISLLECERKLADHIQVIVEAADGVFAFHKPKLDDDDDPNAWLVDSLQQALLQSGEVRLQMSEADKAAVAAAKSAAELAARADELGHSTHTEGRHFKRSGTMARSTRRGEGSMRLSFDSDATNGSGGGALKRGHSYRQRARLGSRSGTPVEGEKRSSVSQEQSEAPSHGARHSFSTDVVPPVPPAKEYEPLPEAIRPFTDGQHALVFMQRAMRIKTCRIPTRMGTEENIDGIDSVYRNVSGMLSGNASASAIAVGASSVTDAYAVAVATITVLVEKDEDFAVVKDVEGILTRLHSPESLPSVRLTEGSDTTHTPAPSDSFDSGTAHVLGDDDLVTSLEAIPGQAGMASGDFEWIQGTGLVANIKSRRRSYAAHPVSASVLEQELLVSKNRSQPVSPPVPIEELDDFSKVSVDIPRALRPVEMLQELAKDREMELQRSGINLNAAMKAVDAMLVRTRLYHALRAPYDVMMSTNSAHRHGEQDLPQADRQRIILAGVRCLERYALLVFFQAFLRSKWHEKLPPLGFADFLNKHPFLVEALDIIEPFVGRRHEAELFDTSVETSVTHDGELRRFSMDPHHTAYTARFLRWQETGFAHCVA